jgi:hypothetical protein
MIPASISQSAITRPSTSLAALATLACLSLLSPSLAGDSVEIKAELKTEEVSEEGEGTSRRVDFSGSLEDYPEGAIVNVLIQLKGNKQFISRYETLVDKDSTIKGQTNPMTKDFLPGIYEVQFWLNVQVQNGEIKRWFNTNRGWTGDHSELLKLVELKIGSEEERAKATEEVLKKLKDYFDQSKKVFSALEARLLSGKTADAEWKTQSRSIVEDLKRGFHDFDNWQISYVAVPFEGIRYKIQQIFTNSSKIYSDYGRGVRKEVLDQRLRIASQAVRFLNDTFSAEKPVDVPLPKEAGGD